MILVAKGSKRNPQQVIGAVAAHNKISAEPIKFRRRRPESISKRVGIPSNLLRPNLRQRLHYTGTRRIRILIGVQLYNVCSSWLKTRLVTFSLLNIVPKIAHIHTKQISASDYTDILSEVKA
jgi:hypothetical protein